MQEGVALTEADMRINLVGSISSNRPRFDNITGLPSSDLTDDEIDLLRPALYRELASRSDDTLFVKVHDAYHKNVDGIPIFPDDVSISVIYLVRNPMDVAVSYAHHQGHEDFARTVRQMQYGNKYLAGGHNAQLRQKTFGWSGHYLSWMQQTAIPVLCVRYEDMLRDTYPCLKEIATFLDLKEADNDALLRRTICQSEFKTLQTQEKRTGFSEKPEKSQSFFRSGRTGEGKERLSAELQDQIIKEHQKIMKELGYLPDAD